MKTKIVRFHYWECDCGDDLAEVSLPNDTEVSEFEFELSCELGAVPSEDDLVGASSAVFEKIVEKYGGSYRWIGSDFEIDVRYSE